MKKFTAFFSAAAAAALLSVSAFAAGFDAEASYVQPSIVFIAEEAETDGAALNEIAVNAEEQRRLFLLLPQ